MPGVCLKDQQAEDSPAIPGPLAWFGPCFDVAYQTACPFTYQPLPGPDLLFLFLPWFLFGAGLGFHLPAELCASILNPNSAAPEASLLH